MAWSACSAVAGVVAVAFQDGDDLGDQAVGVAVHGHAPLLVRGLFAVAQDVHDGDVQRGYVRA